MPRLLALACAIVLVDTVFFAALAPLLPRYAAQLDLSKADAGLLTGAYALGVLLAALPSGALAAAIGVRATALAGLAVTAGSTVAFGLAPTLPLLYAARFGGGIGSACSWTGAVAWLAAAAPRERRGELIGVTLGAAVAGSLLGPALGTAATWVGPAPAFSAVAGLCLLLGGVVATIPAPAAALPRPVIEVLATLLSPRLASPVSLVVLSPMLYGAYGVLVPLALARRGWGTAAIGALYVAIAAVEALVHPLVGRWADREGHGPPARLGLLGSTAALGLLAWAESLWATVGAAAVAGIVFGVMLVPGMALLSRTGEDIGLDPAWTFGLANLAWAAGHAVGAPVAGTLGGLAGDAAAFSALAAPCLAVLALVRRRPRLVLPRER